MTLKRNIENFIYGEALSDGLKTSFCILIPPLICSYFGHLSLGVSISLGVILAHIPDIPGPIRDRRISMLLTTVLIFIISLLTKLSIQSPLLLGVMLILVCFSMSLIAVFGQKASSIGLAAMLAMVMNMNDFRTVGTPLEHALFISSGALWYTVVSLSISTFRPYRKAQQALSECIMQVADYIRIRASFYDVDSDLDEKISLSLVKQVDVSEKQNVVRELIYANKKLVKDSTSIGRSIVFIFSDLNDIFEIVSSSHYDMNKLRIEYKDEKILKVIYKFLNRIANELDYIAYCINSNKIPEQKIDFSKELEKLNSAIETLEKQGENIYVFSRIYINLKKTVSKIQYIYRFTHSTEFSENKKNPLEHFDQFTIKESYRVRKLVNNLNISSPHFRHAIRLTVTALLGYLITLFFLHSHYSYWLIMTILVIMKPGFSVTKKRNYQRIQGTILGGIIGIGIVKFIDNHTVVFGLMILLMLLNYTFIRHRYVIGTMFLTSFLMLSLTIISGKNSIEIIEERLLDTLIGGFLAFAASYVILPNWESSNFQEKLRNNLIANYNFLYYCYARFMKNEVSETDYKLARKALFVNMADVTSIFQRMISEPKGKQKFAKELNQFTIYNHMFTSYASGINFIVKQNHDYQLSEEQLKTIRKTLAQMLQSIRLFGPYENTLKYSTLEPQITITKSNIENSESQSIDDLIDNLYDVSSDYYKLTKNIIEINS
ncbi:FUSC family membrane protein [Vaginella massiliensis]|uniref:FUSC family membrane protein n=1 Tax=Vaginella massiliensis TaxID=1816680 RepID=UPI003751E040